MAQSILVLQKNALSPPSPNCDGSTKYLSGVLSSKFACDGSLIYANDSGIISLK